MIEDYDYTPVKYDWHKNKHTLRYSPTSYYASKNHKLECNRIIKKNEIPVTEIDRYFDEYFINSTNNHGKELNKKYLWENIENELEKSAINTIKKWDPYDGVVCKIYNVPVKNYVIKDAVIHMEMSWLRWNNNYYDPNYLYTFEGSQDDTTGVLKKYCPLKWTEPTIDNMESIVKKVFVERKKKKKLKQTNETYYTIDLKDNMHIQSIVSFGKYPNKRPFPKRKGQRDYYYDISKPYVNVVDDTNNDSFVTNFSVAYKDCQTHKWINYEELEGNTNSYEAKINPVNIYTKSIRIKPLKYVNTKSMIIYVYVSKNTPKNVCESEEEEVVSYTLVPPSNNQKRCDGRGKRRMSIDWYFGQYFKNVRKNTVKNMIDEQLTNTINNPLENKLDELEKDLDEINL